jgi:pilus assembly protein CpaC
MFAANASLTRRRRPARRKPAVWTALLIIFVLVATPTAQQMQTAFNAAPLPPANEALATPTDISLLVGRSTVLNVGSVIARVSLTVPDIADAMVTSSSQILIHGKQPGTISLFVWDKAGAIKTYEVTVRRDLSALKEQLSQLFPGENMAVHGSGKDVVLSGTVSGQYAIEKAAEVAAGYVDKKENVVNLLKQQEGIASNQVMLRVRFAEVSRSAMQELGATLFANGAGKSNEWFGRTAPPGVPAPDFDDERGLVFSDFLNLFTFNAKEGLGAAVRALQNKGLFQSLAEPNLIATNGKEASFLAGGEYPFPVIQPSNAGSAVTIMFKEFGVRLSFTPTVLGNDLIHLKVKPEVSSLDFANAIVLEGFRIPSLSTRRTETEVELRDGQTFAIAGLLNNTLTNTMSKIPGIGDIPILGLLFRSKAHQKNQTELVVMITPTIIRRGGVGVSEGLPSPVAPFLGAPETRLPPPPAYIGSPRYPANQPMPRDKNAGGATQPAAAPVNALTPASAAPATSGASGATNGTTPVPSTSNAVPSAATAPAVVNPAPPAAAPKRELTKEERRALDRLQEEQRKAADNAAKQQAADQKRQQEADKAAAKRAAQEKVRADKLAKERAKREAEVAKKNEEQARLKAVEDAKKEKAIAEAAARLKEAQAAYEEQMAKVKGTKGQ